MITSNSLFQILRTAYNMTKMLNFDIQIDFIVTVNKKVHKLEIDSH